MELTRVLVYSLLLLTSILEVQLEIIKNKECLCDVKYTHVGFVSFVRLVPTLKRTHYTYSCLDFRKLFKCDAYRLVRIEKYIKVYKKKYFLAVKQVPCCCAGYEEVESEKCEPQCTDPCQNGGICANPGTCSCPQGWTGHDCSIDVDECSSSESLCQQKCENTDGSYTCSCNPGFYKVSDNSSECLPHTARLLKFRVKVQVTGELTVYWRIKSTFVHTDLLQALQLTYSYPTNNGDTKHNISLSPTESQVSTPIIYPGTPVQFNFSLIYKSELQPENQPELTGRTRTYFRLPDPSMEECLDYYNLQQYEQTRLQSQATHTPNPCKERTTCTDQSTYPYFSCQ